jgi:ribosome-binding factor A
MKEGKRQRQVAGIILAELDNIFRRLGLNMIDGGLVSISSVKLTPDLLEARIYLSFFKIIDSKLTLKKIESKAWEIKRELAEKVKHQLRRIPVIHFFADDTLDYVFKMEEIFDQIKKEDPPSNINNS